MDLKYVRSELQKLSEIIDNWNTPQETATLERDLVLDFIRSSKRGILKPYNPKKSDDEIE